VVWVWCPHHWRRKLCASKPSWCQFVAEFCSTNRSNVAHTGSESRWSANQADQTRKSAFNLSFLGHLKADSENYFTNLFFFSFLSFICNYIIFFFSCFIQYICFFILFLIVFVLNNCMNVVVGFFFYMRSIFSWFIYRIFKFFAYEVF
jgi:hypothetical protein